MYETRKEYEAVVSREVVSLERTLGRWVRDGEAAHCPRCGAKGFFDLDGLGFAAGEGNSIYYSTVFYEWRCRICDYLMYA